RDVRISSGGHGKTYSSGSSAGRCKNRGVVSCRGKLRSLAGQEKQMSQALTYETYQVPALSGAVAPDESMKRAARVGWGIIAIFFGLFGTWATIAPLKGAVVANGVVKVEGNRKSVQHLEGGIVKELRVKEGDRVAAGDVVMVLDQSQARAEYEVLTQDLIVLRATEERLRAELAHRPQIIFPEDLKSYGDDRYV